MRGIEPAHSPTQPRPGPPRGPVPGGIPPEGPRAHGGHGHSHGHGGHGHSHGRGGHGHSHAQGGHSHPGPGGGGGDYTRRALWGAFILNGIFLIVEAGIGFWTGSLALLSDAAHMVSDVAALALALWAVHLGRRPATANRSFGLVRAEVLGAFVNAGLLLVACALIFREAISHLLDGAPAVPGWPVIIAGVIGLVINVGSALFLMRGDRDNLNVRGALAHMVADALGSVGAIAAGIFLYLGYPLADPIISLGIGLLVLWGSWGLLRDSTRVLLQFAPSGVEAQEVEAALKATEGVREVHDLHIWTLDGRLGILSAHVVFDPQIPMLALREELAQMLSARFALGHSTLQMEPKGGSRCLQTGCALARDQEAAHG